MGLFGECVFTWLIQKTECCSLMKSRSGLHYSVQVDLWHKIFEVAHRLNIQVETDYT